MPRVTLSFDNGPFPDVTPKVLDALAARGLEATFFVVGAELARPGRRALSERAHAEGHRIGNHTLSHEGPFGSLAGGAPARRREIEAAQELLGDLAHPDRLFRPVGGGGHLAPGVLTDDALDVLRAGAYTVVTWNAVPRDWEDADGWVERALGMVRERPHTLLVLHDVPSGAMVHLPAFLDALLAEGVEFTQELPPACVLLRRGEVVAPLEGLLG